MAKITNTGVHIVEGSAAASDTSGESQIWVKSDTPSSLYHTDDAGTDFRINGITLSAENTTTGGSTLDFTSIPPGVKQIHIMMQTISGSGTSDMIVQIGDSGGFETSGYVGASWSANTTNQNYTDGFGIHANHSASNTYESVVSLYLADSSNNTWCSNGVTGRSDSGGAGIFSGTKSLSGVLTQVRVTHQNGSDTIDANSGISIQFH